MKDRYIVAITGASGAIYGVRLVEVLSKAECEIHLTITEAAAKVISHELMVPLDLENEEEVKRFFGNNVIYYHYNQLESPIASGSYKTNGMIVVPCSVGALGRIASGISNNLVERAADVMLKERRKLILVPRETPFSSIHLENMLRLSNAGAVILPAIPGFYHHPRSIDDQVDFVVSRILDHLGIDNQLIKRYGELSKLQSKSNIFED
ncbi:MAG: hypothetical protein A2W23_04410 [Planctomycetes bacterium RBG_16_43_13]|nr:MAG: hypothetical protein A2W23_04410 [Planctomycetes bacterium RBG_16_43_13]